MAKAKAKSAFVCSECGADYSKWQGQCSQCHAWNSLQEMRLAASPNRALKDARSGFAGATSTQVQTLASIDLQQIPRFSSACAEFDRVLGGGLVPGSAILLGGHPGAGKSTLLLQTACQLAQAYPVLYVTGEESLQQVAMRAHRLHLPTQGLQMLAETHVEALLAAAQAVQPKILIVDSVQTLYLEELSSAPGSVAQVRECAALLTRFAKQTHTVLLLVGHVTKDGSLAGPKVLEHMMDASLLLEGESDSRYRTLRAHKNRFGAVNELGVFAMLDTGLKAVKNPSALFLTRSQAQTCGSAVMATWEGTRPLLVEVQALVDESSLGNPRRVAVGLDANRLAMLLAVLHRHGGLFTGDQDVFLNVAGGIRVLETSADLAVICAVVSSLRQIPLAADLLIFGEVGLSGEIRPVPSGQERLKEAAKHGFKRALVPQANLPRESLPDMQLIGVTCLQEALEHLG
ncbi:DNA repair protein RadA/Sms [Allopseudospirillum japonicum]|uniref:DNA repair protein RadA n=1 Tax=Allopseudospirillum japonicum TaxID=64971 RepID=A0A1H6R578_9GAMM|nr:DNA repair protein RadA [Allopseudospirillum japonicum]SEI50999.1 DNA repair protein RadA/Sms [Allopseudospirillum japonicum]